MMYSRLRQFVQTASFHLDASIRSRVTVSTQSYVATRLPFVEVSPIRYFGSMVRPSINYSCSQNVIAGSLSLHRNQVKFPTIVQRRMGGGSLNKEHKERMRAIRKARKIYFDSLPPRPPKPPVCTKHYDEMCKLKTEPISDLIAHRVVYICSFIVHAWLNAFPQGASLTKLQRDIAFRMQRRHRLPGKLPLSVIMPIVGKLERENYLKTKMKTNGHVLIYRDDAENIVPSNQVDMRVAALADDEAHANRAVSLHDIEEEEEEWYGDDEEWFKDYKRKEVVAIAVSEHQDEMPMGAQADYGPYVTSVRSPDDTDEAYEELNYRPKFAKEQKPKERKVKKRKAAKDLSDPVMELVDIPEGTKYTSRGPRYISSERTDK